MKSYVCKTWLLKEELLNSQLFLVVFNFSELGSMAVLSCFPYCFLSFIPFLFAGSSPGNYFILISCIVKFLSSRLSWNFFLLLSYFINNITWNKRIGLKPFPLRAPKTLLHCLLVSSIADQSDFQTLLIFISSPSFSLFFPLELLLAGCWTSWISSRFLVFTCYDVGFVQNFFIGGFI